MLGTKKDLTERTTAEEAWLWRRRQRSPTADLRKGRGRHGSGMSQAEAAMALGLTETALERVERGTAAVRDAEEALRRMGGPISPTPGELCALARRRAGVALTLAAGAVGVSRIAYLRMECAADPRVVRLWVRRGYQFEIEEIACTA